MGALDVRLRQIARSRIHKGTLALIAGLATSLALTPLLGLALPVGALISNALIISLATVLHVVVRRDRLPDQWTHPLLAAVCVAAPINTVVTEGLTSAPVLLAPLMIAVFTSTAQLHSGWCIATLAVTLAVWMPVHLSLPDSDPVSAAAVGGLCVITVCFHWVARRYVVDAELQRLNAERAAATARGELDERLRAEAERERLRDQFIHAQRMEAVGTLSAGLAHDMNNILGGILGLAELLLEDAEDPQRRADLEDICREASRGAALTHSLLAFSRRGVSRREVRLVDQVADDLVPMLRRTLPKSVVVERAGSSPASIEGDLAQISQLLINLCINGADAMPNGGTLTLTTGEVVVNSKRASELSIAPGIYATISVCDTGMGMDEATRARIFEPFFTTKPVGKGTGLGLAMVFGAVQSHSGAIEVSSQINAGSEFRIFLPSAVTTPARTQDDAIPRFNRRGVVLVIDDEPMVRHATARQLERFGLTALTANGGAEGLTIARDHPELALVILDVSMPAMSGAECFERLRGFTKVPVLIASGMAAESDAHELIARGAAGFLNKPFSGSQLEEHLTKILHA